MTCSLTYQVGNWRGCDHGDGSSKDGTDGTAKENREKEEATNKKTKETEEKHSNGNHSIRVFRAIEEVDGVQRTADFDVCGRPVTTTDDRFRLHFSRHPRF